MIRLSICLTLLMMISCKESVKKVEVPTEPVTAIAPEGDVQLDPVPFSGDLLTASEVAEVFNIDEQSIQTKESRRQGTNNSTFHQWEDPDHPNNGLMIQIMQNPIPDEVQNWGEIFVSSKLKSGESSVEGERYAYNPFDGIGKMAVASTENDKVYWLMREDLVTMIAFNMTIDDSKLLDKMRKLALKVESKL